MRGNILKISQFLEKFYKMYFNLINLIFALHKIKYKSLEVAPKDYQDSNDLHQTQLIDLPCED